MTMHMPTLSSNGTNTIKVIRLTSRLELCLRQLTLTKLSANSTSALVAANGQRLVIRDDMIPSTRVRAVHLLLEVAGLNRLSPRIPVRLAEKRVGERRARRERVMTRARPRAAVEVVSNLQTPNAKAMA